MALYIYDSPSHTYVPPAHAHSLRDMAGTIHSPRGLIVAIDRLLERAMEQSDIRGPDYMTINANSLNQACGLVLLKKGDIVRLHQLPRVSLRQEDSTNPGEIDSENALMLSPLFVEAYGQILVEALCYFTHHPTQRMSHPNFEGLYFGEKPPPMTMDEDRTLYLFEQLHQMNIAINSMSHQQLSLQTAIESRSPHNRLCSSPTSNRKEIFLPFPPSQTYTKVLAWLFVTKQRILALCRHQVTLPLAGMLCAGALLIGVILALIFSYSHHYTSTRSEHNLDLVLL